MPRNKTIIIVLSTIISVLVVASLIWPVAKQRDASIDRAIEADFRAISREVQDYHDDKRRLPDELDDLDLSGDVESRASKYRYELKKETARTYELCAEFKTDTTNKDTDYQSFDDSFFSSSSYSSTDTTHSAGFDCIEYSVFGGFGSFDSSSGSDDFDSFFNDESFDSTEPQEL